MNNAPIVLTDGPIEGNQHAFNIVWQAFVVKRDPASFIPDPKSHDGTNVLCRYGAFRFGDDGNPHETGVRCSIGKLLTPDILMGLYKASYLTENLEYILCDSESVSRQLAKVGEEMLEDLQSAHDGSAICSYRGEGGFHALVEQRLRWVAANHGLEIPSLPAGG